MSQFSGVEVSDEISVKHFHSLNVVLEGHGLAGSLGGLEHRHEPVESNPLLSGRVDSIDSLLDLGLMGCCILAFCTTRAHGGTAHQTEYSSLVR